MIRICVPILEETETVTSAVTAGYFSSIVLRTQEEEKMLPRHALRITDLMIFQHLE